MAQVLRGIGGMTHAILEDCIDKQKGNERSIKKRKRGEEKIVDPIDANEGNNTEDEAGSRNKSCRGDNASTEVSDETEIAKRNYKTRVGKDDREQNGENDGKCKQTGESRLKRQDLVTQENEDINIQKNIDYAENTNKDKEEREEKQIQSEENVERINLNETQFMDDDVVTSASEEEDIMEVEMCVKEQKKQ